jgi:hypothetical protein
MFGKAGALMKKAAAVVWWLFYFQTLERDKIINNRQRFNGC